MQPKVSILIPCYNAEQWIAQAIESALVQTYANTEVIVVDDGSIDDSLGIIKSFGHKIRWETGPNRGGNAARNRLLELSTGKWLQYLDADDYLLPDKIQDQIHHLSTEPEADIIFSPIVLECHQSGRIWCENTMIPAPHDPWVLLFRWYLPQTGSPLWSKQALLDVGGWRPDQPRCQEHELYLRLLIAGKRFSYCDSAGAVYRQWSESTVSKVNMPDTYYRRLEITDRAEKYLKDTNNFTLLRQHAVNRARFECARMIWLFDRRWASQLVKKIHVINEDSIPPSTLVPWSYRLLYRFFGFSTAEYLAATKRSVEKYLIKKNTGS